MIGDEISTSIKATLYERISCPFISSFVLACLFWNWKIPLILFSDLTYKAKVFEIHRIYDPVYCFLWWIVPIPYFWIYGVIFPLLSALFYIYVYTWFARKFFRKWQQYISDKRNAKSEIEKKELLSTEKASELFERLATQERYYYELQQSNTEKINDLNQKCDKLAQQEATSSNNVKTLTEEKASYQVQIKPLSNEIDGLKGQLTDARKQLEQLTDANKQIEPLKNQRVIKKNLEDAMIAHCLDLKKNPLGLFFESIYDPKIIDKANKISNQAKTDIISLFSRTSPMDVLFGDIDSISKTFQQKFPADKEFIDDETIRYFAIHAITDQKTIDSFHKYRSI